MSELVYERLRNTLEILDNYLERAIKDDLNIVTVLDHIFAEEAKNKRSRAYEKQVQLSGFPMKKTLADFDFSFQPSIDKRRSRSWLPCALWRMRKTSSFSALPASVRGV